MTEQTQPPPIALCSAAEVRGIIAFDPSISDLSPFIYAASELVAELCGQNAKFPPCPPYTKRRMSLITTWLAAHFLAIRDPRYKQEQIGAASATYAIETAKNLDSTQYGQQAKLLDTFGNLAYIDEHPSKGRRARPRIGWLGKPQTRWYNYQWRFYSLFLE